MRVWIEGEVSAVDFKEPYVNPVTGQVGEATFRAFLKGDPRFAPDYYEGPMALAPEVGEQVRQLVQVQARLSKKGNAWLSVWALDPARDSQASYASGA